MAKTDMQRLGSGRAQGSVRLAHGVHWGTVLVGVSLYCRKFGGTMREEVRAVRLPLT